MKDQMQFVLLLALTASLPVATSARKIRAADSDLTSRFTAGAELAVDPESSVDNPALVASWAADSASDSLAEAQQADDLYKQGTQALDDHQWQTAVEKFSQLASQHGNHADEALYWK